MKFFKNLFFNNKQEVDIEKNLVGVIDQYSEIGKLVKNARIQKELSIEELSKVSKIPEFIINSIENNVESIRPKNPFIRSILFKLEECLALRKNTLVSLLIKEKILKKEKKELIINKFDFINTWQGTLTYFAILILCLFILKRYLISEINIINIQNVEEKVKE